MQIGLQIPVFTWPGEISTTLSEIVRTAEKTGFSSIWVMDHFFQLEMFGDAAQPMLEAYSTLNYIAAQTSKVKLGTLVTGVVYRHPGALIKTVTTLDVLSGGRAYFGVGAAWYEREARGLGLPFPKIQHRFEMLEETLQIAKQMWSGKRDSFNGKHYQLSEPINSPQSLSKPHPKILIGGMGEKKTLRLVAQYADACNLFAYAGLEAINHKLKVLKKHCETIGRPYDEIERTALSTVNLSSGNMSTDDVIGICKGLANESIEHLILNMPNVQEIMPLEKFGEEIIPAVADL
ncbi:MAG: LLM class F420-dependent oxidoreductase [Candidatus Thorarchaeota archaeon]